MPFIEKAGKRILFIHIPKTGGTSVESWLATLAPLYFHSTGIPPASRCTPQHYRMNDIRDYLGKGYFDYAFTFVRDPYARIESEFRMRATFQQTGWWKKHSSFSLWLETQLSQAKTNLFHLDNHLRPQWEFIGSDVEVMKLEDGLETGLAKVAEILGVPPPTKLPKENTTAQLAIQLDWDLGDRLRVQEFYAKDFNLFEYDL